MNEKTLGQIAYESFDINNSGIHRLRPWKELDSYCKLDWERCAQAVIKAEMELTKQS
jgi:hypothetical protein